MAKNKSNGAGKQPGRKPSGRVGVSVHVYIDPKLRAAVQSHIDAHPLQPDLTAVVSLALKEYLAKAGEWPIPGDTD